MSKETPQTRQMQSSRVMAALNKAGLSNPVTFIESQGHFKIRFNSKDPGEAVKKKLYEAIEKIGVTATITFPLKD